MTREARRGGPVVGEPAVTHQRGREEEEQVQQRDEQRGLRRARQVDEREDERHARQRHLDQPPPDGGLWTGPKIAAWMAATLGRPVHPQRGWEMLQRLGLRPKVPRPRHAKADPAAQAAFKKSFPV